MDTVLCYQIMKSSKRSVLIETEKSDLLVTLREIQ
jgi:hypothetical protein